MPVTQNKKLNLFRFLSWKQSRHIAFLEALTCIAHYEKQAEENHDQDACWTTGCIMDRLAAFIGARVATKYVREGRRPSQAFPSEELFVPIPSSSPQQEMVYNAAIATARWKLGRLIAV